MSRRRSAVVVVALAIAGLAGCSSSTKAVSGPAQTTDPAGANYSYAPAPTFGPGSDVTFDTSSPSPNDPAALLPVPATSAPPAPEQVTYACKGDAPDGVDITYGPNGSDHSANSLPFTHTDPMTTGAEYYVVTAQLQGSGSVTCTTTVQTTSLDGTANDVSNSGSADGEYNIASAQVCSGIDGWEKC